jgi:hypothetical protein
LATYTIVLTAQIETEDNTEANSFRAKLIDAVRPIVDGNADALEVVSIRSGVRIMDEGAAEQVE